jgi:hypothetical protein
MSADAAGEQLKAQNLRHMPISADGDDVAKSILNIEVRHPPTSA